MLVEAAAWAILRGDPIDRISRAARLERIVEVGALGAVAAVTGTLLCLAIPPLRRKLATAPVWVPAIFGLAATAGLAFAFLWSPPDVAALRMSEDPLLLRARQGGIAAALAALIVGTGLFFAPPRRGVSAAMAGVLGATLAVALAPSGPFAKERPPDVFLFSVDTLRADHLGCYGYTLPTSPAVDAFCEEAVVYETAMAPASATIPSYTSLFTGTLQRTHRVYTNFDKADPSLVTLAERLRDEGYRTAAFLEGTFPGSFANLGQGFDVLVQRGITAATPIYTPSEGLRSLARSFVSVVGERLGADLSVTTWASTDWLQSLPANVSVFAHFYWPYPHDPYTPPRRYLELVSPRDDLPEEIRGEVHKYDAEIRFTDIQFGRVLDVLRQVGRYDDAWIVFTADHGEELGRMVTEDEGVPRLVFGHSRYLFDASVHVPLIVKPPRATRFEPGRERSVVSTASLASTLLLGLGIPGADRLVGPLPGAVAGDGAFGVAFSIARNPSRSFDRASVRHGDWRLIETRRPTRQLELLRYRDGLESEDLSVQEPQITRDLQRLLHTLDPPGSEAGGGGAADLSERERRMLEELGYVE
jgi:arylsulfatase A-like enzyme